MGKNGVVSIAIWLSGKVSEASRFASPSGANRDGSLTFAYSHPCASELRAVLGGKLLGLLHGRGLVSLV